MIYKVTKRYSRGPESIVGTYKTQPEAEAIIQEKLAADAAMKISVTYSLYEGMDLIEEFDQAKLASESSETDDNQAASSSSQSAGTGQRFSPSPMSTRPLPKGMPPSAWVDNKDDKDKK